MEMTGSGNRLAPGVLVREYHLQGVLGEGGFGIVYRAYDAGLDRTVAIKEYMPSALASRGGFNQIQVHSEHREAFDAGLRSFINEARLLAKFSHPALVHVYRFFEENGTAYMVMRHYEGQTFRAFLAEQRRSMDERWLTAMLSPILDGLEMLHADDCFHRDIAPDNVFLRTSGMPVLLDFGAARRIIGDMTQAMSMVLKPGYAPIEQYADDRSAPQGAWTDIYQLGAMLYRAITGKVPPTSVARMINDPIRMLTPTQYPGYSAQFLRGVHQALSVRPEDRPQSIAAFKSLLGVEDFSASAWSASDTMPLGTFEGSQHAFVAGPGLQSQPQAPVALAGPDQPEFTTVRLADSLINAPDKRSPALPATPTTQVLDGALHALTPAHLRAPARTEESDVAPALTSVDWPIGDEMRQEPATQTIPLSKSPVFQTKEPAVDHAVGQEIWQPPAMQGVSATNPAPTVPTINNTFFWKVAALTTAAMLLLAGIWLLFGSKPPAAVPLPSVAQEQSWDVARKTGTVDSLQAYLAAYPNGEHAAEARVMLANLNPLPPAVSDKPVLPPVAQSSAPSVSDPAIQTKPSASAGGTPAPEVAVAVKPTPAPLAPNTGGNANTSPAPLVVRPKPEATKSETPPASLSGNKPPEPVEMGTVALKVTPWGNVRVNRSPVGSAPPLTQLNLPEGTHQIEISNPNGSTVSKTVHVTKGEVVILVHKFD